MTHPTPNSDALVERLLYCPVEYCEELPAGYGPPINPDGPEAVAQILADQQRLKAFEKERDELIHDMERGIGNLNAEVAFSAELQQRLKAYESAVQRFVERVDAGEIRSKRTYAEFKALLAQPQVNND